VTLIVTGVGGANLYSLLSFWPLEAQILFGPDPYVIARTIIPFGMSAAAGGILLSLALSVFHGAAREILFVST